MSQNAVDALVELHEANIKLHERIAALEAELKLAEEALVEIKEDCDNYADCDDDADGFVANIQNCAMRTQMRAESAIAAILFSRAVK